jgi:hypothetical protein
MREKLLSTNEDTAMLQEQINLSNIKQQARVSPLKSMIRPNGGPALVNIIPIDQLPSNKRTYSGKSPVKEDNNSVISEKSFHYKRTSMMESSINKKRLQ